MSPRLIAVAALLLAGPALAQMPPPPPAAPAAPPMAGDMRAMHGRMMGQRMFPSMSEAGRAAIREAMMAGDDRRAARQKVDAAREKLLAALAADRLDVAAVKRAMDEERAVAETSRNAKQAAMLAAFQKLSVEDRKAFAADSRAMKDRMGKRMAEWRDRWQGRRGRDGARGDMPAPPPAPPRPGDAE
ncbi:MAG: periplasmic heavy metal sensor [Alphaproteobacteria bacterium]|nr:periplasmic heavy metal sensor [Alphaproteobacteria bacterium]